MSNNRAIHIFNQRVNNRLRVNNDLYLLRPDIKQPFSLDHLQPFIHQGSRIDGNFPAHIPVWMIEGLLPGNRSQFFQIFPSERTPGCGENNFLQIIFLACFKSLKNCRMFRIYRKQINALSLHSIHYKFTGHYKGFLICQTYILSCTDGCKSG